MRDRGSQVGFTLVELLVALVALAGLSLAAGAVAWQATSTRASLAARAEAVASLAAFSSLLHADLAQAADRRTRDADGARAGGALVLTPREQTTGGTLFELARRGQENPAGAARASVQAVRYAFAAGALTRASRPRLDRAEWGEARVLLDGVSAVSVEVYDRGQWVPFWTGNPLRPLPRAVRVSVDFGATPEGGQPDRLTQTFLLPVEDTP
jgi:general secretion pathway protein J